MTPKQVKPYGSWHSPLSAEHAASGALSFQHIVVDGEDIYWLEMRPLEKGRCVIVKKSPNEPPIDVLPEPFNARSRVHEYGGGDFTVAQGVIYFTHFADQRLYKIKDGIPRAITPPGVRFADLKATPYGIVAIVESHLTEPPINFMALINDEMITLAKGHDFYSSAALSLDYKKIAWISWDHPNMPWDETTLWVADIHEQGLTNVRQIDASVGQSFFQPQWGPEGELCVISDKSNWWNLYRVCGEHLTPLFTITAELGAPLWRLGASSWGFYRTGIVGSYFQNDKMCLFYFDQKLQPLALPYTHFSQLRVCADKLVMVAASAVESSAVIMIENQQVTVLRQSVPSLLEPSYISLAQPIRFASQERFAYGFYYPPLHPYYQGEKHTQPPLLVVCHGGPTGHSSGNFNADIQYWTTRGWAVVEVNYAGSSGYGRDYRKSLENQWGIYDVQDCQAAALFLAEQNLACRQKLAITGKSAGGYTALAALTFTRTFQIGAILYGIGDLVGLIQTHKFESHYLNRLVGPYPEQKARYEQRSPFVHSERLSVPVIFFHGEQDKVVPLQQAQNMYSALQAKGVASRLFVFKQEQHGFKDAQTRSTVLTEKSQFFDRYLLRVKN